MVQSFALITVLLMAAAPRSATAQDTTDARAPSAGAEEHIATPLSVGARVAAKVAEREGHLATLNTALDSDAAAQVAAAFGTDVSHVKQGLTHVSDAELSDLATRASRLRQDPVAGDGTVNELLIIFLIVAIVIIVLRAAG